MLNFSSALAARIESSHLFQNAFTQLQSQSLSSLFDSQATLDTALVAKLTQAAIAFSRSSEARHLMLAQEIAYALKACDTQSELSEVWRHILAEIGNFPAGDYISAQPLANQKLPLFLKLRQASRRIENTISLLGRDVVLTDFQASIWYGLHENQFLNVSAPTSAGKSFLVQTYLQGQITEDVETKNIVYIVPSRSLIYEVQASLTLGLDSLREKVVVTSVPQLHEELYAGKSLVFVLTQERLQTILNETDLVFDLIIVDEAQQIADDARGILLLGCLENVMMRSPAAKLLLITPSTKDASTISPLLGIESMTTVRGLIRPVRQNLLFVDCTGSRNSKALEVSLYRKDKPRLPLGSISTKRSIKKEDKLVTAVLELGKEGQSIVYAWGPAASDRAALELSSELPFNEEGENSKLEELADFVAKHIHPDFALAKVLRHGVGIHYGRLPTIISKAIEEYFDAGYIKYLVCTSTLLQGVNLPARNIFLNNPKKGTAGPLEANEFWNLAGRAGRLKRDTHGNVFLVDYHDWECQPVEVAQTTEVEPSICDALSSKQEAILAYALDPEHVSGNKDMELAESVFARLFVDARDQVMDRTVIRALSRHPDVDVSALKVAIEQSLGKVSLPTELLRKNSLISPLRQQKLYDYFRKSVQEGKLNSLIPLHPWQNFPDPKDRLEEVFHAIHVHLEGKSTNEQKYYGWFAIAWMRGESLRSFIDNEISYRKKKNPEIIFDGKRIGSLARSVMDNIENKLRFHYVKYLRCYIDILEYFLVSIGFAKTQEIPPLPLFLELGASQKTMVSAMELGMSRIAAIEVSALLAWDKDVIYVKNALQSSNFPGGKLSEFVRRELGRLGLLA